MCKNRISRWNTFVVAVALISSSIGLANNFSSHGFGGGTGGSSRFIIDIPAWRQPYDYFRQLLIRLQVRIVDPSVSGANYYHPSLGNNFSGILQELVVFRQTLETGCGSGEGQQLGRFLNQFIQSMYQRAYSSQGGISRKDLSDLSDFLLTFIAIREHRYGYSQDDVQLRQIALQLAALASNPYYPDFGHTQPQVNIRQVLIRIHTSSDPIWYYARLALQSAGQNHQPACWAGHGYGY